jgi:hypothetical protein
VLVWIYSISLSVLSTMTVMFMVTNVPIRRLSISVMVSQLSPLDSSNGLSIRANWGNRLSPWVEVVLNKQQTTARKLVARSYCQVIQTTCWSQHWSTLDFFVKSIRTQRLSNLSTISTRRPSSIHMIKVSMWSSLAFWYRFPDQVPLTKD